MTSRKPPGVGWESWIDRQIREASERGEFDDLPGHGKPIPGLDKPHDENWWIRQKLRSEGLSYLPPSLALKKEVEDALANALDANSEAHAREIIEKTNRKIHKAIRLGIDGPPADFVVYDIERVVQDWRERHQR